MGKSLKGRELGVGISQRKDGLYQGSYTSYFGKRCFVYGKTLKEVTKKLNDKKHDDEIGLVINPNSYTLNEWFNYWITHYKSHCRNTTIGGIINNYNKIKDKIGDIKLLKITTLMLQNTIIEIEAKAVQRAVVSLLSESLEQAKNSNLILVNPMDGVRIKQKKEKKDKRVLSNDEVEFVKTYSPGMACRPYIIIGLNTGMRVGEMSGLTWDSIDFDNEIIHVNQTYINRSYGAGDSRFIVNEMHDPKTLSGYRDIPMTKELKNFLLEMKEEKRMDSKCKSLGDLVILTRNGTPMSEQNVIFALNSLVNRINRKKGIGMEPFTPHALRRTFATRAIMNGMNPKILQYILGHNNIKTTLDVYCQSTEEDIRKSIELIN